MKQFRKIIFWCHLIAGVFAGSVVLVMSVTGVLLAYERQITRWANTRNYQVTQASEDAARLPVSTLIANARRTKPEAAVASVFTLRRDVSAPVEVGFGRDGTVFVNPYSGAVFGEGSHATNEFFDVVTDWHRWLGAKGQGTGRDVGRAITGACNLAFLFIVVSGFYLWFPRRKTWGQFKNVLWFRGGLASKARDFNWHNVIGIWSSVPLFIVVLSGVVISYTWAGNLVYRVVGETPPTANAPPRPANEPRQNTQTAPDNLDALFAHAMQQTNDWRSISLRLSNAADAPAVFTLDAGDGGQPHKRATLTLDRTSGEVVKYESFSNNSRGRQLRSILRFAHTGEVAGFTGQTVAGLVSLGAAFLVWTGLSLSWRRFRAWRSRRGKDDDAGDLGNAAESVTR